MFTVLFALNFFSHFSLHVNFSLKNVAVQLDWRIWTIRLNVFGCAKCHSDKSNLFFCPCSPWFDLQMWFSHFANFSFILLLRSVHHFPPETRHFNVFDNIQLAHTPNRLTSTFTIPFGWKNLHAIDYVIFNWKVHAVFQLLHRLPFRIGVHIFFSCICYCCWLFQFSNWCAWYHIVWIAIAHSCHAVVMIAMVWVC